MPTDPLTHARAVVAEADATAAGSLLGIIYRGEPPIAFTGDHPKFIAAQLSDRCLRALADPATVEGIARALARHNNCDPDAMHEGGPLWELWEDEARAVLTFILDQAGRDAT